MLRPLSFRSALLLLLVCSSFTAGAQRFQSTINTFLRQEKAQWQLSDTDVSNYTITDQYDNEQSGVTYTYLTQQVGDIRIFNAVSSMAIRDGKVVHYANRFHPNAAKKANAIIPAITQEEAIELAASHLGLNNPESTHLLQKEQNRLRYVYGKAGISKEDIKVELVLVSGPEALRLAWNVLIHPIGTADAWNVRLDALDGSFIEKNNWTTHCSFKGEHQHGDLCDREQEVMIPSMVQPIATMVADSGKYHVFPLPAEAPSFGDPQLLTNPHLVDASPYGWHDTDGAEGPEYTITRGNNVYAYEDINNLDFPGYSPDGGADLNFDFPFDLVQSTLYNQDATLTNLFYMNNMIHDILYVHGFDEAAGNFQETNYTGNGFAFDYVVAEGQDGGGLDNANFYTPEDGANGRMQMYMWEVVSESYMKIHLPDSIAGNYVAVAATFGPSLSTPVTGYTAIVIDAVDPTLNACDSILNPSDLVGKIAIVERGDCPYLQKAIAAELAGAVGVIVINTLDSPPIAMGGSGGTNIPAVMISKADGEMIKSILAAGDSIQVTLSMTPPVRDGSLDNGIIAHEYGHGLSNRLTGGPSNSDCLGHAEQGGEGWSDWLCLILTIEPGDSGADPRGIGTYVKNQEGGLGIRTYPYSTDMSINPLTYGDVANRFGPHAIGEVWSQTIWDLTWKMIESEGFDPDWFNGNAGNHTAMRLVLEGMRLQGCTPGYLDARDGILAADKLLYDGAHTCQIWEVFARRGMGANADQGSADSSSDQTEDFTMPNICLIATVAPTAQFAVSDTTTCFGKFAFSDLSTDIPQYYNWDFGDGNTSDLENPAHSYSEPGQYNVTLIVTNNVGSDTFQLVVNYSDLPVPTVTGNLVVCEGSSVALHADVLGGKTAIWTLGDTVVHTGRTFLTPALSSPVTYKVIQSDDKPVGNVGPATNSFAGGGNHNTGFEGKLLFETFVPLKLISVLMYAQGAGDRTIRLYDENDVELQAITVPLVNGQNRVTLNLDIPAPGRYSLANMSQNLYRNNTGADYPYIIDNLISIYSSNATDDELNYYYYFYDWIVQEATCVSAAIEVPVIVEPGPFAGFLASSNFLTASFIDISSGNPTSWSWNFGDGSPIDNMQNPEHTYLEVGIYEIELTVSNGSCFSTYRQTIEVGTSSSNDPEELFGLKLYPNPATDEITVEFGQAFADNILLNVTNATGSLVMTRPLGAGVTKYSVATSSLTPGTYQFQFIGELGVSVRRIAIVR
ncbi:MAG: T9SS-dependent M36 family metallopeptidase [Saprospiraceae bacterium]|nr:T9SS-dependent M36 family metallopeptidase [Candidatus Opimibacter skivensis]